MWGHYRLTPLPPRRVSNSLDTMPAAQVSERGRQPNGTVVNMEFRQGAIVVQGGSGSQRAARDIVEEVSNEFETRLGGRGVSR